mmetsp:Transcript_25629/g.59059  ORF Transcript_25629/g.59059 Transcript_25629/m.59059 type:complete len:719 (-) Transcript_25629:225-2381(-)
MRVCSVLLMLFVPCTFGLNEQIEGPQSPAEQPQWLADIRGQRRSTLQQIGFKGGVFNIPEVVWTQTSYIQVQMHPYDRFFYNLKERRFTVDKYLRDVGERYGGLDSMLVWASYTNLGMDDRNQYDMMRALPGGLSALTNITSQLHSHGIRVLWPYNPWDQGTRDEGRSDEESLAMLLNLTGADGFNGDTMESIPQSFWQASVEESHPLALEPELGGDDDSLNWTTLGWGYWKYRHIPAVDRFKWLDARRLTHVCNRWAQDHTDDLQAAFFNGDGFVAWENVWGTWNELVPADAEATRRIGHMLRYFGPLGFLQSADWEPHSPSVIQSDDVFASMWPHGSERLWTLVNRGAQTAFGPQIAIEHPRDDWFYYDCYHGKPLSPQGGNGSVITLEFEIEALGYGCILATPNATLDSHPLPFTSHNTDGNLTVFLREMEEMTAKPLSSFRRTWEYLPQEMVDIPATERVGVAPRGMVLVPGGSFHFQVKGVEIEGDDAHGVDVQFPWEAHPQREHDRLLDLSTFYIDKTPVTCSEFADFLQHSGYSPADGHNFLHNWPDWRSHTFPAGAANKPVTYVSLAEARLYCAWAGKRLPHSYEWQYAAQGNDSRLYPWGNELDPSKFPAQHSGRAAPGPDDVLAHSPAGDSPFGVADLVGNVWQFTDEFQDKHTRAVLVRGSSNYRPSGSKWYFPAALELNLHNKYFLMADSYERAATLGFRCVVDAL